MNNDLNEIRFISDKKTDPIRFVSKKDDIVEIIEKQWKSWQQPQSTTRQPLIIDWDKEREE